MRQSTDLLVIGGDGLIGRAVVRCARQLGRRVLRTSRRESPGGALPLDLGRDDVAAWEPPPARAAILAAAVGSQERCVHDREGTARVNVEATVTLARKLAAQGTFVVFPSSNLVFDGATPWHRADEAVAPRTEYGRQKAETERQLLDLGASVAVVRLTKVWGPYVPLLADWAVALRRHRPVHPYSDAVVAPVWLDDVTEVLDRIAARRLAGLHQLSGDVDVRYADIARRLAKRLGVDPALVQPVPSMLQGGEGFPAHTTLAPAGEGIRCEVAVSWAVIEAVIDEACDRAEGHGVKVAS
ncbi:MAG: sugar nucleotide-binding protein [Acidobacteriota bacterium]|nr:sugar nucleotide-binding protein [Acidobacteriota bacterium]